MMITIAFFAISFVLFTGYTLITKITANKTMKKVEDERSAIMSKWFAVAHQISADATNAGQIDAEKKQELLQLTEAWTEANKHFAAALDEVQRANNDIMKLGLISLAIGALAVFSAFIM